MTDKPIIMLGAGGHAKVLLDILIDAGANVLGILDRDPDVAPIFDIPIIGTDDDISRYAPAEIDLINGLGSVGVVGVRFKIYQKFKALGYNFRRVTHPQAIISARSILGEGVQIMAGAVINAGTVVGANSIINTRASIDHDCRIDEHVHIAPGCVLSGGVSVGSRTHIGTGSAVIQGINIGRNVLIGAGSVVVNDIPDGATAYGVPARVR
ncbi:MAG: acetyltransferase [Selenomonadaceae bacterium]|nr:acetyltransferase [Selenomonadaceae bacterium]